MAIDSIDEQEQDDPSAGVADIRELCIQFQRAIAALASNDVAALETSTAAQDGLAEKLQSWFRGKPSGHELSVRVSPSDFQGTGEPDQGVFLAAAKSPAHHAAAGGTLPDLQAAFSI